jgi:ATPase family protein associated with various cellular activities (AAA)
MVALTRKQEVVTFSPDLRADDAWANYWMRQVTVRLRREVWWCWHERGAVPGDSSSLPPFTDKVSTALDLSRFWAEKKQFYVSDPTARYLSEQLAVKPPRTRDTPVQRGSFGWVMAELQLDDVSSFVLALALTVAFDASMGSVIAACLNDQTKVQPNLALAQKLWDEPEETLRLADPFHPLFSYGVIRRGVRSDQYFVETNWEAPLTVPAVVANQLLFSEHPLPQGLISAPSVDVGTELRETAQLASLRLNAARKDKLRLVPVLGAKGSPRLELAQAIAQFDGKPLVHFQGELAPHDDAEYLNSIATVCWLRDSHLYLSKEPPSTSPSDKHHSERYPLPAATIPATVFFAISERRQLVHLPADLLSPVVAVLPSTYSERLGYWQTGLGPKAAGLDLLLAEGARRFRFEKQTIEAVCAELRALPGEITAHDFIAACRAELDSDIGELASRVNPRFSDEELILQHKQHLQFKEVVKAMQSLTEVHYRWGTGKVWNEGGISVLFAGPPGTGKTMAAEILALKLDLPMYRIDLSQVVNKYIGETEKNLKRVFDVADVSDMILFFDEADSLFGRRTEVSDAHDRYANLEISYLLERMERFKGLAILATNRKRDLDEAFLRRLHYIIDFQLPDVKERKRIWRQVIPERADSSQLDLDFLAEQFPLAGGNIRSVVFNACLQCADGSGFRQNGGGQITMKEIIIAVKREYDKLNRTLSLQQYGDYAAMVEGLERE